MNDVAVSIQRLPHGADLPVPAPATSASAGADLLAAVAETVVEEVGTPAESAERLPPTTATS